MVGVPIGHTYYFNHGCYSQHIAYVRRYQIVYQYTIGYIRYWLSLGGIYALVWEWGTYDGAACA